MARSVDVSQLLLFVIYTNEKYLFIFENGLFIYSLTKQNND